MNKRWKPEEGERYWVLGSRGDTVNHTWNADQFDIQLYNTGNCFRAKVEAEAAAEKVKEFLLALHEETEEAKKQEVHLPDWCKVGEWVWVNNSYHKITCIGINGYSIPLIILDNDNRYIFGSLSWDDVSQACPRPYNEKEMEALVGKVLRHDTGGSYLVTAFENRWNQIEIDGVWRDADELMKGWTWPDGKPCCKLVHKEGAVWVE